VESDNSAGEPGHDVSSMDDRGSKINLRGGIEMEISTQEYNALMQQMKTLQDKVDNLSKEKQITSIADKVSELPIKCIWAAGSMPHYLRRADGAEAWGAFLSLAKLVHTSTPVCIERRESYHYSRGRYFDLSKAKTPIKITDLSNEQINMSIAMLNEMISVYNRYFKELHPTILVNFRNDCPGAFREVPIADIDS